MGTPADLMAMSNMRIGNSTGPSAWLQEWDVNQMEGQRTTCKYLPRRSANVLIKFPVGFLAISSPLTQTPMSQFRNPTLSTGFYMPSMMQAPGVTMDKGKAKVQDAEFEAAFARFEEITQDDKEKEDDSTGTTDMDA
jgi:hypothetical protein